jgi:hypothetical protein
VVLRLFSSWQVEVCDRVVASDRHGEPVERDRQPPARQLRDRQLVVATANVLHERVAVMMTLALPSCFKPRIGRSRATLARTERLHAMPSAPLHKALSRRARHRIGAAQEGRGTWGRGVTRGRMWDRC